jgi:hypothetical protein
MIRAEHSEQKAGHVLALHRGIVDGDADEDVVREFIDDPGRVPGLKRAAVGEPSSRHRVTTIQVRLR